jgi:nucleoid-associated protein YejK
MEIKFVIIHELKKTQSDREASKKLSQNILDNNLKVIEFVTKLHDLFTNHVYNYTHAVFEELSERKFPEKFKKFYNNQSKESFIAFTKEMMDELISKVENTTAKGGFIVFALYNIGKPLFTINMLRETQGYTFLDNESDIINPTYIDHLDLDKLTMACQIDLNKYYEKQDKYLKFTKNSRMNDVSDYFYKWIAIDKEKLTNTKIYNDVFVEIINNIKTPVSDGIEISRDEFKKQCLNYIKSIPDNIINLSTMGEHFYPENPTYFLEFASENDWIIDSEFKKHSHTLTKLWKFDTEVDNIRLAFRYVDFTSNKIKIINNDKIIITSLKLAERIKAKIDEEENGN